MALSLLNLLLTPNLRAADVPAATSLVPLPISFPKAAFQGTPPPGLKTNSYTEPFPDKQPPVPMVPQGLKNIASAPGVKITCSDTNLDSEALAKLTDGNKDASEESILFMRKGAQWVQLDFGKRQEIFAVALWHAYDTIKVYRDVVVQVADDSGFVTGVRTIFNNDHDDAARRGVGTDREYFETQYGKVIKANGVSARCIRFYSNGSTQGAMNEYTEVEVYGRPAK